MQKRIIQFFVLLLPLGLIAAYKHYSEQQKDKEKIITELVINGLQFAHYQENKIDDEFSKKVYKSYLERIDYTKKFLLKADIDKLHKYETLIDDELRQLNSTFLDLSNDIITQRIKDAEEYYVEILAEPFDFTIDEDIELDDEKNDYAESTNALKSTWRKALKYQVMIELKTKLEIQEKAQEKKDTSVVIKTYAELEKAARTKVEKRNKDYFRRLNQQERTDRYNLYMNSISLAFDPHTNYFPPKNKEDFDISMSGQLEGIGATLQEKDGFIKVVNIVPGSPSYKQGDLKVNDLILKVAQGDSLPLDIVGMRLDKAVRFIRGAKGTTVKLTVKKVDGSIVVIAIVRDIVIIEETYAKSVIVKEPKSNKRIGYIYLPSFYVNFNAKDGGRRSADDVLKEINKLKKENVDALIIDLRNDGGGSLSDVVKMAGYFIPQGPIVQVKQKKGEAKQLSDTDPRVQYEGPVAVMVNSNSASASEIFAAALQDYDRAVIIGGKQTFGKGTVQRFINLDDIVSGKADKYKPFGALKLTFQKFYRISGGSTQLKGVEPDVVLPDNYMYIEYGEAEMDYRLPYDEIPAATYVKSDDLAKRKNIIKASKKRISKNKTFDLIEQQAKSIKKHRNDTKVSLNLETYKKYEAERKEESNLFKDLYEDTTLVLVSPLAADWQFIEKDSTKLESAKKWHKKLMSDPYLLESIKVVESL
ncbi:MAG: tail-specific protease [Bacteroidetes bacterium 4572_112]|nr:MAG: tail-specific protease [Bacteroidetes bacterium 4572_112]